MKVAAIAVWILFMTQVRCQSCPKNCIQCHDGNNCTKCVDGFYNGYWKDTKIQDKVNDCTLQCGRNCEACSSYFNCTECKARYCNRREGRSCRYRCSTNCETCSSCDLCTKCKIGYYGRDCSMQCEHGCLYGFCDSYWGFCYCRSKFIGAKCDECIVGKYGTFCDYNCPKACLDDTCERSTGTCKNGCQPGYNKSNCDTCMDGFFGDKCERCLQNCLTCYSAKQCSKCKERFWGSTCEIKCPHTCTTCVSESICDNCVAGYYDTNCTSICPMNCANSTCQKENGHCPTCKSGLWGKHCKKSCGRGCSGKKCDQQDARCFGGCRYGFTGSSCEGCAGGFYGQECWRCPSMCAECISKSRCTFCVDGYYGQNCSSECSEKCYEKKCRKENGSCLSCKEGFYGEQCILCPNKCATKSCKIDGKCNICIKGYYGETCDQTCPQNCKDNCIINNGYCRSCIDGYFGHRCDKPCPVNCSSCSSKTECTACKVGYTGNMCEHECSNCKNGTSCRQTDGRCNEACVDRFFGDGCDKRCSPQCRTCARSSDARCTSCAHGKYSEKRTYYHDSYRNSYLCDLNCSETCLNKTCDQYRGRCTNGCESGSWGTKCEHKCSENCKNRNCSTTNGSCLEGCDQGFYGENCTRRCKNADIFCSECAAKAYDLYGGCIICKKGYHMGPSYAVSHKKCKPCPSECAHQDCNTTNGICLHGCAKGHWGETCEKPCVSYCLACNQSNGICLDCMKRRYGVNCLHICSSNCTTSCEIKNGECTNGCATENRYGRYCEKECSPTCLNLECNWETGVCSSGCLPGFFGRTCDIPCSENCANNSCNWLSGDCILGCLDGFEGLKCTQVVAESVHTSVLAGIVFGIILILTVIGVIVAIRTIRHRKRKITNNKLEMAERDPDENSRHVEEACADGRNGGDIEDSDPGVIYAKSHKPSKKQLRKSTTEHKTSVSLQLQGRTHETTEHEASVALEVHGETKETTEHKASVALEVHGRIKGREKDDVSNEEEEIISDGNEPSTVYVTQDVTQDDGETYYNTAAVLRRRIQLEKLKEFVSKKAKDEFLAEFKQLPFGLIKSHEVSQKTENKTKNRYRGIFPYDARRVVIKNGPSDYINASYIDGYMKRNAYIASLGPTVKQMGEDFAIFWEMIWQENVNRIVMLTNLRELGVHRCDQYWPDKGSRCSYGNILVKCLQENIHTHYTIRTCIIVNEQNKTEVRTLYHMHFTSWPDKGIPKSVSFLTEFHTQTTDESFVNTSDVPVLVHCSAGVGRTGTYIALDILTNEGRAEGHVDIFACVRNLREERVNMIQTVEQYMYLHECLVEQLTGKNKTTNKSKGKNN